jgi:Domain of unknown function (DUF222)
MLIAEADVAPEVLPADDGWASMEDLLGFAPGPALGVFLSGLDVNALDERCAAVVLQLVERQQAWVAELAVRVTARLAGPAPPPDPNSTDQLGRDSIDAGANMVAATLGMTTRGAQTRVDIARAITDTMPACQAAMAAGAMGYRQAWIVADAITTAGLGQLGTAAVDARVASLIAGQSWGAFRRTLRRALLAANADLVLAEHTKAMQRRAVEKIDLHGEAMSQLQITLSAVDAQTVWLGLDATAMQLQTAAKAAGLMDEGIDAYRADALVAWAEHALGDPNAPRLHGRRHQVQFLTDLPSLLGLADNPADMLGYGPIPAALMRGKAAKADWRRLIIEPVTGMLLDFGSVVYRPPAELADYLVARDRRCRFPGCNTPATYCDIDHNIPAPKGSTSAKNCCCLCHRHHQLKTFSDWSLELKPDGSCLWTSPCGRQFVSDPPSQPH